MKRTLLLLFPLAFVGCQPEATPKTSPASNEPQTVETLGIDYAEWPLITENPYPVEHLFAFFCAAPSPAQQREIEADKKSHGPHIDMSIVVRVNPIGLKQFKARVPVPQGTVIIKEKLPLYRDNGTPLAVAVMIKREAGYDPEHDDWEYAFQTLQPAEKKGLVRGKLANCIDCHQNAKDRDYLFRPYVAKTK